MYYSFRTCATRPFQVSAFFFNPHGDCPSLKFHLRSESVVAVGLAEVVTLLDRGEETLLTGKAVAERARHANKRVQMTFDAEIIVFALDLGV
jgi:hypothetical protein